MFFEPHTSNPANYRHIKRAGKKSSYSGFSMERNISLARSLGVISVSEDDLVDISEIETYPKNQICVISTGSQGEPRSSLNLSAQNSENGYALMRMM